MRRQGSLRGQVATAGAAAGLGLVAVAVYSAGLPDGFSVFAVGMLVAAATLAAGGLLGLLFAVPRSVLPGSGAGAPGARSYEPNTNLEQISDWLTKILVGVGLVQLGAIREGAGRLFAALAPSLGGRPSSPVLAGALVVYFGVVGFLAGWLATRLFLAGAMADADRQAVQRAIDAARAAQSRGDTDDAQRLLTDVQRYLDGRLSAADLYESVREAMPAGADRTAVMERIVADARAEAGRQRLDPAGVRAAFAGGDPGDRVKALGRMQGDLDLADLDTVLAGIGQSQSAFEQFHALELARRLLPRLDPVQIDRLEAVITDQMSDRGWIKPGTDRRALAEDVLGRIRDRRATGAGAARTA